MKKLLCAILALTLCIGLTGFTFYEDASEGSFVPSLERFLAGENYGYNGTLQTYHSESNIFSIDIPSYFGPMEMESDLESDDDWFQMETLSIISEDGNVAILVLRMSMDFGFSSGINLFQLEGMAQLMNEYLFNDVSEIEDVTALKKAYHPRATEAYSSEIYLDVDSEKAKCTISYLELNNSFYMVLTGSLVDLSNEQESALRDVYITLREY